MKAAPTSIAAVFILVLATALRPCAGQANNPCHPDKPAEAAYGCTKIVMPSGLNQACRLKQSQDNGNFFDCTSIYDLNAECRTKMHEFVELNPCDTRRKELVERWNADDIVKMDYWAYSMLEQCCDNVPEGAQVDQYGWRNEQTQLWSLDRGNGPAHFFYDICTLYPDFKYFKLPWGEDHDDWPSICSNMKGWIDSPAGENWITNFNADIPDPIRQVLGDAMWALECHNYESWIACVDLESKQSRLG